MRPEPSSRLFAAVRGLTARRMVGGALVALALTSGSAEAARVITGRDIAPGTITSRNVKDGSIEHKDLSGLSLERLRGMRGLTGPAGPRGDQGPQGQSGSAGAKGDVGARGATGVTGEAGPRGLQGVRGYTGYQGPRGLRGRSAYGVWLDQGNTGTEAAYLQSLRGADATELIAVVDGDATGTLLVGSHVDATTPVTHDTPGGGVYQVRFDRVVSGCAFAVTGRGPAPALFTAAPGADDRTVAVSAFAPDGTPVDAGFSLTVFCG